MRLTPEQLRDRLRRQDPAPLYLVSGDEPLQCQEAADAVRAQVRSRGAERAVCTVEPGFDWASFEAEVNSLSLFSPWRLIELVLGGALPGVEGGRAIVAYARRPPENTILLIRSRRLDAKAKQSAWFKAVDASGLIVEVSALPTAKLAHWLIRRMESSGFRLARDAAEFIAERVDNNLVAASHEVEKLQLVAATQDVTLADAIAMLCEGSRYDVFALVDQVVEGRLLAGIRALRGLRAEGVEAALIHWALSRELRTLCRLADRLDRGQPFAAAFAASGVWERRKPAVERALQRHGSGSLRTLLLAAGGVERIIKGVLPGDAWHSLERLCMGLAGTARASPAGL